MIDCFAGLLEFRLQHGAKELVPIAKRLASACAYVIEHWNRFDISPEIYGDLPSRYTALQQTFVQIGL